MNRAPAVPVLQLYDKRKPSKSYGDMRTTFFLNMTILDLQLIYTLWQECWLSCSCYVSFFPLVFAATERSDVTSSDAESRNELQTLEPIKVKPSHNTPMEAQGGEDV
jgi:hypothetical protein